MSLRVCLSLAIASLLSVAFEASASAQIVGDGSEFFLEAADDTGPVCISLPAMQADEDACRGLAPPASVPADTPDMQTLVVARRKVGDATLLMTVSRMPKVGQSVVGPRTIEDEITPLLEESPKGADVSLVEARTYNVPHARIAVTKADKDGTTLEAVQHIFFGTNAIYFVTFFRTPGQHDRSQAWEAKALPTVRLTHPSRFNDKLAVPKQSDAYSTGRTLGWMIGFGLIVAASVIGVTIANRRTRRRDGPLPPHEDQGCEPPS